MVIDEPGIFKPVICYACFQTTDLHKEGLPCRHVLQACKQAADAARKSQMDTDIAYKNSTLREEREHCALIVEDPIPALLIEAEKIDQSGGDSGRSRHVWAVLLGRAEAIRKQPVSWQFKPVTMPEDCPNCHSKGTKKCKAEHATPAKEPMKYWRCPSCHHHWEAI